MASDTAVAEAPPQAELEQLRPATFQCFTVFGTSQEREIPKALIGSPRRGGAFAKWYSAQWKLIRYELAALGNIAARESIKQQADRKRVWQQLPANMVHRNERARLARRVRALKVAREGAGASSYECHRFFTWNRVCTLLGIEPQQQQQTNGNSNT